jgi:hypothetical protein
LSRRLPSSFHPNKKVGAVVERPHNTEVTFMLTTQPIDIHALINSRPIGGFQKWVVFLGFLIIGLDGLDVAIMGFIAPQLKMDWGLSHSSWARC